MRTMKKTVHNKLSPQNLVFNAEGIVYARGDNPNSLTAAAY